MQKDLSRSGGRFPFFVVPGLRLGRTINTVHSVRRDGEPAMDFVERILREKPVLGVEIEEGQRGFEQPE